MFARCHKAIAARLGFRRRLPSEDVPLGVVQRIQLSQLDAWLKIGLANVPVGIVVSSMLYWTQWDKRDDPWLQTSYGGIVLSYLILLTLCLMWKRQKAPRANVVRRMRHFLGIRFILGSFWAFGLIVLTTVADPEGRSVMLGVAVALMSTTVFSGPAPFAYAGWIPATIGAFGTAWLIGTAPLVCLLAYTVLTYFTILSFDRQTLERNLNLVRLERHAETISILLRDFEESSSDWLWETDGALTLRHISPRFSEAAQRKMDEMEVNLIELIADPALPPHRDPMLSALQQRMVSHASFRELVVPVQLDGERRWWALTGKPLFDSEGRFTGYRGVGADVTMAHRSRERIAYLARHDTLTDLANRTGFNEALINAIAACRRQPFALLCVDLDEFKTINDSYGHDVGDAVLRAVAQRMRGVLRAHDVVARLGGDEFAVVVNIASRQEATAAAERLIGCLDAPFSFGDVLIRMGGSVGVAVAPEDGEDPDDLYRNADLALYRAKSSGRGVWRMFDATMDRQLHERRLLQRDLRDALSRGELFVAYQPIVDLATSELIALEALVRWRHPERGIVPPADFVPMAEQSGQIAAIGGFVLTEAAGLAVQLPPSLRIAVNLSPLQLRDEGLVCRVREILDRAGVTPERIEFEITESVMLDSGGRSLETLRELRSRGHRLAIDDFGTGYSSLSVLRGMPFDRLKIDRSFINDLNAEDGDGPIVRAVIGLARALGISVTAEGVESERQARMLQNYRCMAAQGFYFSRPLSPAQVLALVAPLQGALPGRVRLPLPDAARSDEGARDLVSTRRAAVMATR